MSNKEEGGMIKMIAWELREAGLVFMTKHSQWWEWMNVYKPNFWQNMKNKDNIQISASNRRLKPIKCLLLKLPVALVSKRMFEGWMESSWRHENTFSWKLSCFIRSSISVKQRTIHSSTSFCTETGWDESWVVMILLWLQLKFWF